MDAGNFSQCKAAYGRRKNFVEQGGLQIGAARRTNGTQANQFANNTVLRNFNKSNPHKKAVWTHKTTTHTA